MIKDTTTLQENVFFRDSYNEESALTIWRHLSYTTVKKELNIILNLFYLLHLNTWITASKSVKTRRVYNSASCKGNVMGIEPTPWSSALSTAFDECFEKTAVREILREYHFRHYELNRVSYTLNNPVCCTNTLNWRVLLKIVVKGLEMKTKRPIMFFVCRCSVRR